MFIGRIGAIGNKKITHTEEKVDRNREGEEARAKEGERGVPARE